MKKIHKIVITIITLIVILFSAGCDNNAEKTNEDKNREKGDPTENMGETEKYLYTNITGKIKTGANPGKFRFAVVGDPQVQENVVVTNLNSSHSQNQKSATTMKQAVTEMNGMNPKPDFIMFTGDIVNSANETAFKTFGDLTAHAQMPRLNTHGNHDTPRPFTMYHQYMPDIMGFSDLIYSFDAGVWHFISFPYISGGAMDGSENNVSNPTWDFIINWLKNDLETNKDKPIIFFAHFHLIPQGLSQMEWYTPPIDRRLILLNMMEEHGNVKYFINGHTHNGVKASVKMMHNYRGTTHISAPSVVISRQFEEEYSEYDLSLGGFYMIIDIDGNDIKISGRQAFKGYVHDYPLFDSSKNSIVPVFTDEMEPRWTKMIWQLPSKTELVNGGFENTNGEKPEGWIGKYRYRQDINPAAVMSAVTTRAASGARSAYLHTRPVTPANWAQDEYAELYQIIDVPQGKNIRLDAKYYLEKMPVEGGGFIRAVGMNNSGMKFIMMFKWGSNEKYTEHLSQAFMYEVQGSGVGQPIGWLSTKATEYTGMYYTIDSTFNKWNELSVDIKSIYDASHLAEGSFDSLGVTKLLMGIGVYSYKYSGNADNASSAWFDDISLTVTETAGGFTNNGNPIITGGSEYAVLYGSYRPADANINDATPPLPLIPKWKNAPAVEGTTVTMTAVNAVDPSGVEYLFEESINGTAQRNSGWTENSSWTFNNIQEDTVYGYRYRTRDKWPVASTNTRPNRNVPNEGAWSETAEVNTGL